MKSILTASTVAELLAARPMRASRFSTDDTVILVSTDNKYKVIIENGLAKVFSTTDNKTVLNVVSTGETVH